MCLGLKGLWVPKGTHSRAITDMHIVRLEKVKREQDHRRGKPEPSGVVAVGLLGKQVPFLQRLLLYRRLPLWIAFFYYLLFLNE